MKYQKTWNDRSEFLKSEVVNDIDQFKTESDMIIANRFDEEFLVMLPARYIQEPFRRD